MKIFQLFFLFFFTASFIYSQSDITNTLGTNGALSIKDANNVFLTVTQSTGEVNILKGLRLEDTYNSSTTGVIFKGTDSFIHNFYPTGGLGHNTFVGVASGNFTMSVDAFHNTGLGFHSLQDLTTGSNNTALGSASLANNTTGSANTGVGSGALVFNTTGSNNACIGASSLNFNTTGFQNTAIGTLSLNMNTSGYDNTASGYQSLVNNTTGRENTAMGVYSLQLNTTGFQNTAIGHHSLQNNTGNYNTALGYNAGSTVTSGFNLTLIGIDANPSTPTVGNQITLGNTFVTSLRCNVQTITSLSDARDKKNIKDLNLGIDFLMKVKPRVFNWDKRDWYENNISDGSKMQKEPTAGFIAQELDEVQTSENAEWLSLVLKDNPEKLEATPGNLLPIIVKAIQDLKKENDELKTMLAKTEQTQYMLTSEIEKFRTNKNEFTKVSPGEQ
jgi:hypothetical protein